MSAENAPIDIDPQRYMQQVENQLYAAMRQNAQCMAVIDELQEQKAALEEDNAKLHQMLDGMQARDKAPEPEMTEKA